MSKRRRIVVWAVIAFVVLLATITTSVALYFKGQIPLFDKETDLPAELVAAEARWAAHSVAHYDLWITRTAYDFYPAAKIPVCTQIVEVQNEKVIATLEDSCSKNEHFLNRCRPADCGQAVTVSEMFQELERNSKAILWSSNGVGCELLVVSAAYDLKSGMPMYITYKLESPSPANMGWAYVRYLPPNKVFSCLLMGVPGGPNTTISLTTLP